MRPSLDEAEAAAGGGERRYRGVRRRKWGRWVSEIRLPNSRERIWLGSYDSPEKAARAFDAAVVCLRGRRGSLNFPDAPPRLPPAPRPLTHQQIQIAAARHANYPDSTGEALEQDPSTAAEDSRAAAAAASHSSSPGEVLDGFTAGSELALDWSFMDMMTSPGGGQLLEYPATGYDEFSFEDFPASAVAPEPAEEIGSGDYGTNIAGLWSF